MGEKGAFSQSDAVNGPAVPSAAASTASQREAIAFGDECTFLFSNKRVIGLSEPARHLLSQSNLLKLENDQIFLGSERAHHWLLQNLSHRFASSFSQTSPAIPRQLLMTSPRQDLLLTLLAVPPYSLGETDADAILLAHAYARDVGGLPRERIEDLTAPHPWRELGLTPTEMEIAKQLLDGRSVVEIAEAHSISREGVRFHIKGLLGKTHCHRQSQLVAKLAKLMWQSTF